MPRRSTRPGVSAVRASPCCASRPRRRSRLKNVSFSAHVRLLPSKAVRACRRQHFWQKRDATPRVGRAGERRTRQGVARGRARRRRSSHAPSQRTTSARRCAEQRRVRSSKAPLRGSRQSWARQQSAGALPGDVAPPASPCAAAAPAPAAGRARRDGERMLPPEGASWTTARASASEGGQRRRQWRSNARHQRRTRTSIQRTRPARARRTAAAARVAQTGGRKDGGRGCAVRHAHQVPQDPRNPRVHAKPAGRTSAALRCRVVRDAGQRRRLQVHPPSRHIAHRHAAGAR